MVLGFGHNGYEVEKIKNITGWSCTFHTIVCSLFPSKVLKIEVRGAKRKVGQRGRERKEGKERAKKRGQEQKKRKQINKIKGLNKHLLAA